MRKWNYETRQYEDYATPHYWHCPIFSYDMEEEINCASCGRKIKYGEGYASLEIHTSMGMGYNVCEKCHAQEIKKRLEAEKIRQQEEDTR